MNRVLLDQGLAPKAAALLCADGWDAIHVQDVGLHRADDKDVLEFAREHRRTCVTLDHDFHTHLALSRSEGPSVILIRLQGLNSIRQAELIRRAWALYAAEIETGAALSVDRFAIRVRKLTLG
jgi:predicted nuclease of predicted toxin-antitoxin system